MMSNILLAIAAIFGGWAAGQVITHITGKRKKFLQRFAPIGRHFKLDDMLISQDWPVKIKQYRPTSLEWLNAKRMGAALDLLADQYGKPQILSGGRPKSVGDFYTALKRRGFKPSKHSQHERFAAVDIKWDGGLSVSDTVYRWLKDRPEFLQVIYYRIPEKPRFHLSVPEPERPNLKQKRVIKSE
jgi:hypothetical protein